jgi:hypothetical protein
VRPKKPPLTLMGTQKGGDNWDGEKQGEYGEHAFREPG